MQSISKKKILHIIAQPTYSGVTTYSVRIIKNVQQYDHHILSCYKGNAFEEIRVMNISYENLVNSYRVSYRSLLLKYFKLILFLNKTRFDIIHYHQGGIGVLLIAVLLRKKAVVIHHLHGGNLIGDTTKEDISTIHLMLLRILSKHTHRIAVANHVYKEYEEKINNTANLHLIRNSVPFDYQKKKLTNNAIGFIGRFNPKKGFKTFLLITSDIKINRPQLQFYFMGEKINIKQHNLIHLPPSFDVKKFYKCVDLIIFSSIAMEGLPLVILEAISFDVGVVAYPLKANVEILGKNYPLLCSSESEIISKIEYYYSNSLDRLMLSTIHQKRIEKFKYTEMIKKLEYLYSSCSLN